LGYHEYNYYTFLPQFMKFNRSLQFLLSGFTLLLKSHVQKHELLSRPSTEIFRSMQIESKSMKVAKIKYENTNRRTSIKSTFK